MTPFPIGGLKMNELLQKIQSNIEFKKTLIKNAQKQETNNTLLKMLYEVTGEFFELNDDNLVIIGDRHFSMREWGSVDSFSSSWRLTAEWPDKQKKYIFFGKPVIRTVYREIFDAEDFLGVFED